MKSFKSTYIILICFLLLLFSLGCEKKEAAREDALTENNTAQTDTIGEFDANKYNGTVLAYSQRAFAEDVYLGQVKSYDDAIEKAEVHMVKIFGEKQITSEKPLKAYYDTSEKVWLVTGSLDQKIEEFKQKAAENGEVFDEHALVGGVAHILIRAEDGKVLAVWHED